MPSFEASLEQRLSKGSHDPDVSNLEYYARPENYTGAVSSMQQFIFAAQKSVLQKRKSQDVERPGGGNKSDADKRDSVSVSVNVSRPDIVIGEGDADDVSKRGERRPSVARQSPPAVDADADAAYINRRRASAPAASDKRFRRKSLVAGMVLGGSGARRESLSHPRLLRCQAPRAADTDHVTQEDTWQRLRKVSVGSGSRAFGPSGAGPGAGGRRPSVVMLEAAKMEARKKARERLRHAIKLVLILLKWISSLTEQRSEDNTEGQEESRTFTGTASEEPDDPEESPVTFDLSLYKANHEINISAEVKAILSGPPSSRTPEQLQTTAYGLQHLESFAEYPLHMQEKLCQVGRFEQVPHKRVIIRQGHTAENFYFILSGHALVRLLEKNPQTGETHMRTATVMRKGTSFGELALLHHSRRTATVVSQDTVQLLTIARDDFFDIFMGGASPGEVPEHIAFATSMDFMQDWPAERLLEHPECCLFHFFKRGVVIVQDSNKSDWLYIVKSGSCTVMKGLAGVRPRPGGSGDPQVLTSRRPHLGTPDPPARVDSGLRRPHSRALCRPADPAMESVTRRPHTVMTRRPPRDNPSREGAEAVSDSRGGIPDSKGGIPDSRGTSAARTSPLSPTRAALAPTPLAAPRAAPDWGSAAQPSRCAPGDPLYGALLSRSRLLRFQRTNKPHFAPGRGRVGAASRCRGDELLGLDPWGGGTPTPGRVTPAPPLSRREEDSAMIDQLAMKGPVFVQIAVLKPKDVFGLTSLEFDTDIPHDLPRTSVSLVSNGAECVMLSKRFFMEHTNENVRKQIRHQLRHYPTEDTLQRNLQTRVDWELYKKRVVRETLAQKRQQTFWC